MDTSDSIDTGLTGEPTTQTIILPSSTMPPPTSVMLTNGTSIRVPTPDSQVSIGGRSYTIYPNQTGATTVLASPNGSGTSLISIPVSSFNPNVISTPILSTNVLSTASRQNSTRLESDLMNETELAVNAAPPPPPRQPSTAVSSIINHQPPPVPEITYMNVSEIRKTKDLFLLGTCWFFAKTSQMSQLFPDDVLVDLIQRYGGVVLEQLCDFNLVTHLVMADQTKQKFPSIINLSSSLEQTAGGNEMSFFRQCLNKGKFTVTIDYLLDILNLKEYRAPWKWLHVPNPIGPLTPVASYLRPKRGPNNEFVAPTPKGGKKAKTNVENVLKSHTLSITGFSLSERNEISEILRKLGCNVHVHLNKTCTLLMTSLKAIQSPENYTYKIKRAQEWRLPVVTFTWLRDILLGVKTANSTNGIHKYFVTFDASGGHVISGHARQTRSQAGKTHSEIHIDPERINHIMNQWKLDAKCNPELLQRADVVYCDRLAMYKPQPRVLLTGFDDKENNLLYHQIEEIGARPVKSMFACTHLVTNKIKRTVKFLSGLSVCSYVLKSSWIEEGAKQQEMVPEEEHKLVDMDTEQVFQFTLEDALSVKSSNGPLFKNFIFCITPQVVPSLDLLTPIISAAGGTVLRKVPTIDEIVRYSETQFHTPDQLQLVVISCYKDEQYIAALQTKGCVNMCTADFILDGVLRQKIDFNKHKLNLIESGKILGGDSASSFVSNGQSMYPKSGAP